MERYLTGHPSIDKPWLKYYSEEIIDIHLPECTIYEYLWENNKEHLEDIALNYYDRKFTFGYLFEQIEEVAKSFVSIGVKKGDIVTFAVLACPETVISFYALNKIGAITNMINVLSSADEYVYYINEVESKFFVCWESFYNVATTRINETNVNTIIVIDPSNFLSFPKKILFTITKKCHIKYSNKIISWEHFIILGKNVSIPRESFSSEEPCIIAHTGGTTGEPKSVLLSNKSVNSVALQYDKVFFMNVKKSCWT